ncbi:hypothetical protein D6777_04165 [Candidatus Woesearchaeota archaeon]|nr:MAG: hypothetical protein D6777_04165 [Candidatus Woesearchaeota archaeon]
MNAKSEYIELLTEVNKINGLDDLSSKIMAILFASNNEMALEDIAKKTGYSLSAVSTALKSLNNCPFLKRMKKPNSRKVYFYLEKDLDLHLKELLHRMQRIFNLMENKLPKIINDYKTQNVDEEELKMIQNHYKDIKKFHRMFENMLKNEKINS